MTIDPADDLLRTRLEAARRLAHRLVYDRDLAEDVAQESMRVALRRPADPDRDATGWLRGIVRNVARGLLRGERRRRVHEAVARPCGAAEDPAAVAARVEEHRRLFEAVLRLDEPYRTTIVQRYLDDLSPSEIAARSSVPVETVRTRLRRGVDRLREDLDARHGGDRRRWAALLVPSAAAPVATSVAWSALPVVAACLAVLALGAGVWIAASRTQEPVEPRPSEVAVAASETAPVLEGRRTPDAAAGLPAATVPTAAPTVAQVVEATGPQVRVRIELPDGTPAEGVGIEVKQPDGTMQILFPRARDVLTLSVPEDGLQLRVQSTPLGWFGPREARRVLPSEREVRIVLQEAWVLRGTVLDPEGSPLPGALFRAYRADPDAQFGGETAPDGTFLATLHGGKGTATIELEGTTRRPDGKIEDLPVAGHLDGIRRDATEVVVRTHRVDRGRTLRLVLRDPSGMPVAGTKVTLGRGWRESIHGWSDPHGEAVFSDLLAIPTMVYAWLPWPVPDSRWVRPEPVTVVPDSQTVTLDYVIGRILRGVLVDPKGAPRSGAQVLVTDRLRTRGTGVRTDERGRFEIAVDPATQLPLDLHADTETWAASARVETLEEDVRLVFRPRD